MLGADAALLADWVGGRNLDLLVSGVTVSVSGVLPSVIISAGGVFGFCVWLIALLFGVWVGHVRLNYFWMDDACGIVVRICLII